MFLHLGQDIIVNKENVIGIFDLDNCSGSHITRKFLAVAQRQGDVQEVAEELPKSFIITNNGGNSTVYLSQLSTATLQKRSITVGFEGEY
ncbi:MAG: DUF370 domain-containing protein [Oscillospiraceae bacterium]|nr:DUF370 domain-containing protein [Oscillospiraceae bacterium]